MGKTEQESCDAGAALSEVVVTLLKGVLYRGEKPELWGKLLDAQTNVRAYVAIIGLVLIMDEAEGYAYLQSKPESCEEDHIKIPRLVVRQQLSFGVSLLLALLRKKLAEFDAAGGDTRLILSRDEIVEIVRVFISSGTNEARIMDRIDADINKVKDLGFLRKLPGKEKEFEVRRIIKAFINAEWLSNFDEKLEEYRKHLNKKEEDTDGRLIGI